LFRIDKGDRRGEHRHNHYIPPPYNLGGDFHTTSNHKRISYGSYKSHSDNLEESEYQKWQIDFLNQCFKILKPKGSMFYNHKIRIKNGLAIHPISWILKSKFLLKQEIVWNQKKSANSDKIRFFPYTERIYWIVKDARVKADNTTSLSDCWDIVPVNNRKHTGHVAVMPEKVVNNILSSVVGQLVLDPFIGSGTTAVVCQNLNRDFIGIEISPEYCKIAEKRLNPEQTKLTLLTDSKNRGKK